MRSPWGLLSTHGLVLAAIARRPDSRVRDVADELGMTERTAQQVISDLVEEGYLERIRAGRRNRYLVKGDRPLGLPAVPARPVEELIRSLGIPGLEVTAPCEAIVLACSDYRLQPPLQGFLADLGLAGRAEVVTWPGGGPALAGIHRGEIFQALSDVVQQRQGSRLLLVSHSDCQVPAIPTVAGATPPATYRAVRRWARRIAAECVRRLGIAPELWLLDRGRSSLVDGGGRDLSGQGVSRLGRRLGGQGT